MKPRIAIFGLPKASKGRLKIWVFASLSESTSGNQIFQSSNNESEIILENITHDIKIDSFITIRIMSSGLCEYSHKFKYQGADISLVPIFKKEQNTNQDQVSDDWDITEWQRWNPNVQHHRGLVKEKQYLASKEISIAPIWESYYSESSIDYFEKFQKLWIGLNSFATYSTGESQDKKKILALVNSPLRQSFNRELLSVQNQNSADKWRTLQAATGLDMSSDIVRDEIASSCSIFDFLKHAKLSISIFSDIELELSGLIFLDSDSDNDVFRSVFTKYYQYMASEEGIVETVNFAEAFTSPKAPIAVTRIGRLVFHDALSSNQAGTMSSLDDFFGSNYGNTPYQGQTNSQMRAWEMVDPLFFRYLLILYKFRCAYFHGDMPMNGANNKLAQAAYQSLMAIYPEIIE